MPQKQKRSAGGNRKHGRNKLKCERYRAKHGGGTRKKIVGSHRSRGCTPLGYVTSGKKRPKTLQELSWKLHGLHVD